MTPSRHGDWGAREPGEHARPPPTPKGRGFLPPTPHSRPTRSLLRAGLPCLSVRGVPVPPPPSLPQAETFSSPARLPLATVGRSAQACVPSWGPSEVLLCVDGLVVLTGSGSRACPAGDDKSLRRAGLGEGPGREHPGHRWSITRLDSGCEVTGEGSVLSAPTRHSPSLGHRWSGTQASYPSFSGTSTKPSSSSSSSSSGSPRAAVCGDTPPDLYVDRDIRLGPGGP